MEWWQKASVSTNCPYNGTSTNCPYNGTSTNTLENQSNVIDTKKIFEKTKRSGVKRDKNRIKTNNSQKTMKNQNKTNQKYPSPEVYDHERFTKKSKISLNNIPKDLWYLSVILAALIVAFLALVTK